MPEALPLQPGDPRRLGAYEITGRLGVGEQGAVFLGRGATAGVVAVKLLHVRLSGEPVARSRFAGSFTAARKVAGFCTAAILDADVEGDRPYVVSEWVDGPSLQQLVEEEGVRGGAVVERLAVGSAIALAAVHRAGALHHALKPGNILLGRTGPRMCDFGIAGALEAVNAAPGGRVAEDPAYKAPEQLSGQGIGAPADVFAWAVTMLFAATGKAPFGDDSPSDVMQRIMYDDPDLSVVPESLRGVMADALAKDPAERPTSKILLERLLDGGAPLAGRMPPSMVEEGRALTSGGVQSPQAPDGPPGPAVPSSPGSASRAPVPDATKPEPIVREPEGPGAGFVGAAPGAAGPGLAGPWTASYGSGPDRPGQASGPGPQAGFVPPRSPMGAPPPPPNAGAEALGQGMPGDPEPSATDLDPAAFEATAAFTTVDGDDSTTVIEVGPPAGQTTAFASVEPDEPHDRTETAPHLIPGLKTQRDGGEQRRFDPGAALGKLRRPSNHVLGVALSLTIGVGVGIAIIALVLWPQLKGDDAGPPVDPRSDNRPVSTIPASFAGTWKGTLINTNRNVSFPVVVTFEKGGTTARAVYPRENCTGTLTLSKGTERALDMNLVVPKPCTSGTVRVVHESDGTLQYSWSRPGTQLGYAGKLSRN